MEHFLGGTLEECSFLSLIFGGSENKRKRDLLGDYWPSPFLRLTLLDQIRAPVSGLYKLHSLVFHAKGLLFCSGLDH